MKRPTHAILTFLAFSFLCATGAKAAEIGEEQLFQQEPKARGYLRPQEGYRLFEKRAELCGKLTEDVKSNREWLLETLQYPLANR